MEVAMTAYTNLPWERRLEIMRAIETCGSVMVQGHVGTGFIVAYGRGRITETNAKLSDYGFKCSESVYMPLGTDTPQEHLRHDSITYNVPRSMWCYGSFVEV
jgi:hypothetical protein